MALIVCPECEKRISEFAPSCPNCGCPMSIIEEIFRKRAEEEKIAEQKRLKEEQRKLEELKRQEIEKKLKEEEERKRKLELNRKNEEEKERLLRLENEKREIAEKKKLEEYQKYLKSLRVAQFDLIEVEKVGVENSTRSIRVDIKRKPHHKIFIDKAYMEVFQDNRGILYKIVNIKKNNPYEGLGDIVPGLTVASTGVGHKTPTSRKVSEYNIDKDIWE